MLEIGRLNQLAVIEMADLGAYLDGGEFGDILLPTRELSSELGIGDELEVFVYRDGERNLLATLKKPLVQVGECANLQVKEINDVGIFLDWGLDKDLFLPFSEQQQPMEVDRHYVVYVYLDNEQRIAASNKLDRFIDKSDHKYTRGEKVNLLVAGRTELGYKVVVNNLHWGVLYYDQVFKRIRAGYACAGYIQKVREDQKLDLSLEPIGIQKAIDIGDSIIAKLHEEQGYLALSDKSSPQAISAIFGVSKGTFKKAIGKLYKDGLITISKTGIVLNEKD
ncbi:GntR family transcriptional regulator [Agarivorans sp. Toyoura001]|uniref:CvfB family protein n=1 Tax=Agarivorans sp. Toyoura001 TaxID=2283141 RepID=UPI0010DCDD55|nr:S1-like domain-containing RNA-binding protein [Agarivorans sp. Toyoura001]GDY24570.1 GntR family transcriptional regulator [Agarivorans sp. Toyoura001]